MNDIFPILLQIGMFICIWKMLGILDRGLTIKYGKKVSRQCYLLLCILTMIVLFLIPSTRLEGWIFLSILGGGSVLIEVICRIYKWQLDMASCMFYIRCYQELQRLKETGCGNSMQADKIKELMDNLYSVIPEKYYPHLENEIEKLKENT